jgi:hypothetical protein
LTTHNKESGGGSLFTTNEPAPATVDQQTKPVEQQEDDLEDSDPFEVGDYEDDLEHYKATTRFYRACAVYQRTLAIGFLGALEGTRKAAGMSKIDFEQWAMANEFVKEAAAEAEAAYDAVADWDEDEDDDIERLMPPIDGPLVMPAEEQLTNKPTSRE